MDENDVSKLNSDDLEAYMFENETYRLYKAIRETPDFKTDMDKLSDMYVLYNPVEIANFLSHHQNLIPELLDRYKDADYTKIRPILQYEYANMDESEHLKLVVSGYETKIYANYKRWV